MHIPRLLIALRLDLHESSNGRDTLEHASAEPHGNSILHPRRATSLYDVRTPSARLYMYLPYTCMSSWYRTVAMRGLQKDLVYLPQVKCVAQASYPFGAATSLHAQLGTAPLDDGLNCKRRSMKALYILGYPRVKPQT